MNLPDLDLHTTVKRMPATDLPVTTSVAQLDRARVLLSPASTLSPEALRSFGAITDIVAPSLLHTAGIPGAAAVFPEARLWGPPGAAAKLPAVRWTGTLGVDPWPYEEELALLPVAGMPKVQEHLFLHKASRSLIATDLVFNVVEASGPGAWLFLHLFGTWRRLAVSRLFLRFVKDKARFRASLQRVAALEFDNLVPGHGAVVEGRGRERLVAALRERGLLD